MNVESKRNELSRWIKNLDEQMLERIDELKKSLSNGIVIYTSEGKGLTQKEYKIHLDNIRKNIDKGEKTYSSKEIRKFVLER
ncbi:hypothetical protein [Polaribacter sp. M15]